MRNKIINQELKMRYFIIFIIICLLVLPNLSLCETLIPTGELLPAGQFKLKYTQAFSFQSGLDDSTLKQSGFLYLHLGLLKYHNTNRLEIGLGFADHYENEDDLSLHIRLGILSERKNIPSLACGVLKISSGERNEGLIGFPLNYETGATFYGALSKNFLLFQKIPLYLHLGYGNGVFDSDDEDIPSALKGFFGGIESRFKHFSVFSEWDGYTSYIGGIAHLVPELDLTFAIGGLDNFSREKIDFSSSPIVHLGLSYQASFFPDLALRQQEHITDFYQKKAIEYEARYEAAENMTRVAWEEVERLRNITPSKIIVADTSRCREKIQKLDKELYETHRQLIELMELEYNRREKLNTSLEHLSRSLEYIFLDEYAKAKQECLLSIRLYPDLALAHARLGSIYYKLGERQNAIKEWEIALSLDSSNKELRKTLKKVRGY